MPSSEVLSLPVEEIEPFLDRRRYAAFVPTKLPVDAFLREILSKANDFVPAGAGSMLMDNPFERDPDPARTPIYFVVSFGPLAADLLGQSLTADRGIVGQVYRTGRSYLMNETAGDPVFLDTFVEHKDFETSNLIAVPIRIEQTVCGVLELINREGRPGFSEKDLQLLEVFARYTSASIENLLDAQRASEMARLDDLTGLFNDRFFHHRLTEDLIRADVQGSSVALLFLDLDDFKGVNDNHGHLAGSQVLKEFGFMLKHTVEEEGSTLARYGGDEFVVILPDHDVDRALAVANRIRTALRGTEFLQGAFSWAEQPVYWRGNLTCTLGVAVYPDHVPRRGTTDLKKNLLLRAADQAMYAGKDLGKDRVELA